MLASSLEMDGGIAFRTALADDQVNQFLESIDTGSIVGLRDRTLLMVLTDPDARARAIARFETLANPVCQGKLSGRSVTP